MGRETAQNPAATRGRAAGAFDRGKERYRSRLGRDTAQTQEKRPRKCTTKCIRCQEPREVAARSAGTRLLQETLLGCGWSVCLSFRCLRPTSYLRVFGVRPHFLGPR